MNIFGALKVKIELGALVRAFDRVAAPIDIITSLPDGILDLAKHAMISVVSIAMPFAQASDLPPQKPALAYEMVLPKPFNKPANDVHKQHRRDIGMFGQNDVLSRRDTMRATVAAARPVMYHVCTV